MVALVAVLRYNKHMLFMSFFNWWYRSGWKNQIVKVGTGLSRTIDQFSIPQLAATLFSPFRQISAGSAATNTSMDVKYHMWADRLFSRFFGAFVRFFTILTGIVVLFFTLLLGGIRIIGWLALPLLPIVGLIASASGWLPWK